MVRRRSDAGFGALTMRGLWLALALIFLGIGLQKLTAYEAAAVRPFAIHSPFLAWTYGRLGTRGAAFLFAAVEIPTGLGLAWGVFRPGSRAARLAAVAAAVTAFVTTSFVFTSPGAIERHSGLILLTVQVGQLFAKDLVLLAAALVLVGESRRSRR